MWCIQLESDISKAKAVHFVLERCAWVLEKVYGLDLTAFEESNLDLDRELQGTFIEIDDFLVQPGSDSIMVRQAHLSERKREFTVQPKKLGKAYTVEELKDLFRRKEPPKVVATGLSIGDAIY